MGLYVKVFYDDNPARILGHIDLTNKPEQVCEYFGFEYEVLKTEFSTEEDFFEFMTSSIKFNPNFFAIQESFNHTHRKRATKRPVYIRFMKYVEEKFQNTNYNYISMEEFKTKRAENKASAAKEFGKLEVYCKMQADYEKAQIVKTKFNGGLVSKIIPEFGVKIKENKRNGKYLGEFIQMVKSDISDDEFLEMERDAIETLVLTKFSEFEKTVDW